MRRAVLVVLALALVLSAGCRRGVNVEKTVHLAPPETPGAIIIEAPPYDQQVTVTVSCPVELDVYLVLQKDLDETESAITAGKKPASVLAGKEKVTEATLEGKVPARSGYAVVFGPRKTGDAKVKIVGK